MCEQAGVGAKGERDRESWSRLQAERGAWHGAQPQDPEITIWAEIKSRLLNWPSHPGALYIEILGKIQLLKYREPMSSEMWGKNGNGLLKVSVHNNPWPSLWPRHCFGDFKCINSLNLLSLLWRVITIPHWGGREDSSGPVNQPCPAQSRNNNRVYCM